MEKFKFEEPLQAFLFNLSMTFWQTSRNGMNERNLTESTYPCWLKEAHKGLLFRQTWVGADIANQVGSVRMQHKTGLCFPGEVHGVLSGEAPWAVVMSPTLF